MIDRLYGMRFRDRCKRLRLSQTKVAQRLGVTVHLVRKWQIGGNIEPNAEMQKRIDEMLSAREREVGSN